MRPAKRILLAVENESRASVLKFMLATRGYRVTAALSAEEARAALANQSYDLLLCELPFTYIEALLLEARNISPETRSMVIGAKSEDTLLIADQIIQRQPVAVDLLERVKVILWRKRGPKPLHRPPEREAEIFLDQAERNEIFLDQDERNEIFLDQDERNEIKLRGAA